MTKSNKVELALIALVCLLPLLIALPNYVSIAKLTIWSAALLLLQSLIRDLAILWSRRKASEETAAQAREAACFCAESTIGIIGIVVGSILLLSRIGGSIMMTNLAWAFCALVILSIGYLLKGYIIQWKPLKIFKDPNHLDIVVKWS